jgi:hypothetical protein
MQARECEFRLASGRKCRAAANRNQPFCRHHAPVPAVPGPPPIPKEELYSDLRRWRRLGSQLHSMPVGEVPHAIWDILQCLVDRGPNSTGHISDLTAGRFLRTLLTRLGDVPFADPDFALASVNQATPSPYPGLWPEAATQPPARAVAPVPGSSPQDLNALFAALGLPRFQAPVPQPTSSRMPVNQSHARVNQ